MLTQAINFHKKPKILPSHVLAGMGNVLEIHREESGKFLDTKDIPSNDKDATMGLKPAKEVHFIRDAAISNTVGHAISHAVDHAFGGGGGMIAGLVEVMNTIHEVKEANEVENTIKLERVNQPQSKPSPYFGGISFGGDAAQPKKKKKPSPSPFSFGRAMKFG